MKKYELTAETKVVFGRTLHRIRALVAFGNVNAGELGGWIEKEDNLDHYGNAWVCDDARVCGNACVCDNACVYGDADVYGNAEVYGDACVCGNACVYGNAEVYGDACVYGNADVYGNAEVYGDACVCGNACVYGNADVYGDACVCGNACVYGNARVYGAYAIMTVSNVGSRNDTTTFFARKDKQIGVTCGYFSGTIDEFEAAVKETHGDNEHGKVYMLAIEMAKLRIKFPEESEEKE